MEDRINFMVIDRYTKKKIRPNIKPNIEKEYWPKIEEMFTECYLTHERGNDIITIKPPETYHAPSTGQDVEMALQFYAVNGAYYGVDDWKYVRTIGKLL